MKGREKKIPKREGGSFTHELVGVPSLAPREMAWGRHRGGGEHGGGPFFKKILIKEEKEEHTPSPEKGKKNL